MAESYRNNQPLSADDALPPVEPPSAGFILQLFVVPGIIVVIIVMVWLLFNWVARTGNDPDEYIRDIKRNNASRWQAAFNLAQALGANDAQGQALREDAKLADDLAGILAEEIRTGSTKDDEPIKLRDYLCLALGRFSVPNGLPTLLKAAATQRNDAEIEVRLSALRAIAMLAENLRTTGKDAALHTPEVYESLLAASQDSDPRIRSAAAFAMGVIGGEAFQKRLVALLADGNPDVRYNAATWLASVGDAKAIPVLAEMLDPDELVGVDAERDVSLRADKRALIVTNALRASERLAEKNRDANLAPLEQEMQKLLGSSVDERLKKLAAQTLKSLRVPDGSRIDSKPLQADRAAAPAAE